MFNPRQKNTQVKTDKVFLLVELMLRWAFQCGEKIITNILEKNLQLYYVTNSVTDGENEYFYIAEPNCLSSDDANFFIYNAFSFVFLKEDVEKIEKEFPEYLLTGEKQMGAYWVHYCNMNNIEKIAPQLLYSLVYLYSSKVMKNEVSIRVAMSTEEKKVLYCPEGNKLDWVIPLETLFYHRIKHPIQNLNPPTLTPVHKYSFQTLKKYLAQLLEELNFEQDKALQIILKQFPTVKNADFAKLIHPNPESIHFESLKTNGKRLKKRILKK